MARSPIIVGAISYPTKKALQEHFRAILRSYRPGDTVSDAHQNELLALLERHPEHGQKVGAGIASIQVQAAEYGQQCFWITRTDGTRTDFSYISCVNGVAPSTKQLVMQSFRRVVDKDITIAKRKKFEELAVDGKMPCPATAIPLEWDDVHADHQQPMTFEVICETFLHAKPMTWDEVPVTAPADQQTLPSITDQQLADEFQAFHKRCAKIRLVARRQNLSEAGKHRLRKNAATRTAQLDL